MPKKRQFDSKDQTRGASSLPSSSVAALPDRYPLFVGETGRYLGLLLLIAFIVRLIPAALIFGSNDVSAWIRVSHLLLNDHNPYETGLLNWPPLWPAFIYYSARLALVYNLPLYFCVKLTPILADVSIAFALYVWFWKQKHPALDSFKRALWYALNPVAIFTVSFHGQFDSFPALFALLAIMDATEALERASKTLTFRSALWLGLGVLSKTWPALLLPICLRVPRSFWQKAGYILLALGPAVVSVAILYQGAPVAIQKYVLNYRSSLGWWGLTTVLNFLPPAAKDSAARCFQYLFYFAVLGTLAATWKRGTLKQAACLILLTFFVFTPGFGLQYLVWIVPLGLLAEDRRTKIYTFLAGATIALQYIFRPFDGSIGLFLAPPVQKTSQYALHYGGAHDTIITCLVEMPLWAFFCWWWGALLREILSSRKPGIPKDANI